MTRDSIARVCRSLLGPTGSDLPWEDESVEQLDGIQRSRVGTYWYGRAAAELHVAAAFVALSKMFLETGSEPAVANHLATAIESEHRHATVCHALAVRYLGHFVDHPQVGASALPQLLDVSPPMRAAIYATGLCAINETIATVWMKHCLDRSATPLARDVNRRHLSDEVWHARIGWGHLVSVHVTSSMRRRLAGWLVPLLDSSLAQWLKTDTAQGLGVPEHGIADPNEQRSVVLEAIRDVVVPGFDHVGVDVSAAVRWLKETSAGGP